MQHIWILGRSCCWGCSTYGFSEDLALLGNAAHMDSREDLALLGMQHTSCVDGNATHIVAAVHGAWRFG